MNKYALVTGGSRGIGRAVAVRLAQDGYQVIINYASNQAEAEKTLEQIGGKGELMCFDVSDAAQTREALQQWQQQHPDDYIEVVVNNAGIRRDNVMALMPEADWHRVLDITLSGFLPSHCCPPCRFISSDASSTWPVSAVSKDCLVRPTILLPRAVLSLLPRHWHRKWPVRM